MKIQLYRMDDTGKIKGVFPIKRFEAKKWNAQNYGIFHTIQEFHTEVRKADNLKNIRCWAIDIDGDKEQQVSKILNSPLYPSMIVESKNGHHLYWFAKDATLANYNAIVERRLCFYYNADRKAKDICRILRTPYFYHCKDPNDKFFVRIYKPKKNIYYTEREMLTFFKPEPILQKIYDKKQIDIKGTDFWDKANNIPCTYALEQLSGSSFVNGEIFEFNRHSNGTKQIVVNGKNTSSWIDCDNKIGSYERGGPGISNWLWWYHRNWAKVANILKQQFKL